MLITIDAEPSAAPLEASPIGTSVRWRRPWIRARTPSSLGLPLVRSAMLGTVRIAPVNVFSSQEEQERHPVWTNRYEPPRVFYSAVFVIAVAVIVLLNMVLFGDTLVEAVASPYMWIELLILAGTLLYLYKD